MNTLSRSLAAALSLALPWSAAADDLLVSSRFSNNILRYDSVTGDFLGVFAEGPELANPNGIAYGPDGNLYVGLGDGDAILRYDGQTGAFIDTFTTPAAGGLGRVRDIEFGPDGDLYVASAANDRVLQFDGANGDYVGVAGMRPNLDGPVGLTFSPSGELYVGVAITNRVFVFAGGVFQRRFYAGDAHGNATGLAFNDAGELLVAQSVTNEILAFDGEQGLFDHVFADEGLNIPIYMERAPNGDLIVGSFGDDSVLRYDSETGGFLGTLVPSGLGGLDGTHDFAFVPVPEPGTVLLLAAVLACAQIRRRAHRLDRTERGAQL